MTTGMEPHASRVKLRPPSTPAAALTQARQLREAQNPGSSFCRSIACRAAHVMRSIEVSMRLTSARKTSLADVAASQFLQSFGRAVPASRSTLRVSVSCRCRFNREPSCQHEHGNCERHVCGLSLSMKCVRPLAKNCMIRVANCGHLVRQPLPSCKRVSYAKRKVSVAACDTHLLAARLMR